MQFKGPKQAWAAAGQPPYNRPHYGYMTPQIHFAPSHNKYSCINSYYLLGRGGMGTNIHVSKHGNGQFGWIKREISVFLYTVIWPSPCIETRKLIGWLDKKREISVY